MAITVNTQIAGQEATTTYTYCYLYEPLRVSILDSEPTAEKLYIDIEIYDTNNGSLLSSTLKYAEFDINSGEAISVDLMKIVQQYNNAGIYKFADVTDMSTGLDAYKAIITEHKYSFKIYSDKSIAPAYVRKLPLIGGRMLEQFTPTVNQNSPTNEFEYYNIDINELKARWKNVLFPTVNLVLPTLSTARPIITRYNALLGEEPCGGFLVWKSRFGGWMFWGFDLEQRNFNKSYEGSLEVGMFESTKESDGKPYIPVNYTKIKNSYSISLKSLGLSSEELLAVAGINSSPAVYYQKPGSENLELMRLTSASTPISSLANGGDFSVSLRSISNTSQLTI